MANTEQNIVQALWATTRNAILVPLVLLMNTKLEAVGYKTTDNVNHVVLLAQLVSTLQCSVEAAIRRL